MSILRPRLATSLLGLLSALAPLSGCGTDDGAKGTKSAKPAAAKPAGERGEAKKTAKAPEPTKTKGPEEAKKPKRTFRKGQPIPPGLSPEEVAEYNRAQGDPKADGFTLEDAFAGDPDLADKSKGKLVAEFTTTMGKFDCELFEDEVPLTVANFVGLARGVRPFYDKKADKWVTRPFYDGLIFHRVIRNFMIQTGDPLGSGTGGPGYHIIDEISKKLKHSGPGILSMANRGPNTGSSQFFITVRATPHLDGKHAVFGRCQPKVPVEISKVKTDRRFDRPFDPPKIESIRIVRKKKLGG